MEELALLHPQWAGHSQVSVIPLALCPAATLLPRRKGPDHDQLAPLVCIAHSRCLWPTAIAQLAAPIFTMPSAPQQMANNHRSPPCLPTTKALHTWYLEARTIRQTVVRRDLHQVLTIPVVATTDLARRHSFPTTPWRGLTCVAPSTPAHALSPLSRVTVEHPPHLQMEHRSRLTSNRPHNSKSRSMHLQPLKSLPLWFP